MNRSKSLLINSVVFSILTIAMCITGIFLLNPAFAYTAVITFAMTTLSIVLSSYYYYNPDHGNKVINGFSYILLLPVACCIFVVVFICEFIRCLSSLISNEEGGEKNAKNMETMRDGTTRM